MRQLRPLNELVGRDPSQRVKDSFLPREWDAYFGGLPPEQRRAASMCLCRKVLAAVSLPGGAIELALAALADGRLDPDLLGTVESLVERTESEYESLVGDDEAKLSCGDPVVAAAFRRTRAATALQCALQGDLTGMAYEAWFVLNDLDEVRMRVGMPLLQQ
jgi:hypothetical protein